MNYYNNFENDLNKTNDYLSIYNEDRCFLKNTNNTINPDDLEKRHLINDYYIISQLKHAKGDSEKAYLISKFYSKKLASNYLEAIENIDLKVDLAFNSQISDNKIIEFLSNEQLTIEQMAKCLCGIKDYKYDEIKINFLKKNKENVSIPLTVELLKGISDENKILYCKEFLSSAIDISLVFITSSDETKLNFIKNNNNAIINFSIACTMILDSFKIQTIPYLNRETAIDLMCSLKPNSKKYCLDYFKLSDKEMMKIIYTFLKEQQQELCDKYGLILLTKDIYDVLDEGLTIGIELEVEGPFSKELLNMEDNQLFGWHSKTDGSLQNGVEITSPILTYSNKSIRSIYNICQLLKNKKQYTTERCGGHIHFGYNYFNSEKMLLVFYILFSYFEKEIYSISNAAGSIIRNGVSVYAMPISPIVKKINDAIKSGTFNLNLGLVDIFKQNQSTRYSGLNLFNIGNIKNTIEFRIPNSEINPDEILHNIILYGRIIMKAKELSEDDNKFIEFISMIMSDHDSKINNLLNLIFDDEQLKLFYKKRYENNKDGLQDLNFSSISIDDYSFLLLKYYTFSQIIEANSKFAYSEEPAIHAK